VGQHFLVAQQGSAGHHLLENSVVRDDPQGVWIQLVGCAMVGRGNREEVM